MHNIPVVIGSLSLAVTVYAVAGWCWRRLRSAFTDVTARLP